MTAVGIRPGAHDVTGARTVDDAVGAALRDDPSRVVVRWRGQVVTASELWDEAGRWASAVRAAGAQEGDLVAVCLPRTPALLAALVGVHRAGCGYVPVDPAYPRERVDLIVRDSGSAVAVGEPATQGLLGDTRVVTPQDAARAGSEPAQATADGSRLSHVIYTSGSTGTPKGVAIEHRQTLALLAWASKAYGPEELAGVLASTSVCFDLSVFEIFATLALGGTVVLADNALELPSLPDRDHVTLVNTVPSAMGVLTRTGGLPAGVRTVNLAGEPLRRRLADAVLAQPGVERLLNLYGPSEDTTYSTVGQVLPGEDEPSIGQPLPGTRAYLLDGAGVPVSDGAVGELHLAGAGVARGYLGRPGLTAERFLPDPWVPGERMYRTGDLCTRDADGRLHYRGRVDHQVKVRGFRVELGEVDAALLRHPDVALGVTVARHDERSDSLALVAFVEGREGTRPDEADLLARLERQLPAYMVPARLVVLGQMPLTPNGKVDREALPEVDLSCPPVGRTGPDRSTTAEDLRAPAPGTAEEVVARTWAEVLGLDRVPVDRTFAQLGGNSLLAAAVIARLVGLTGRRLRLPDLAVSATVPDVAARLANAPVTAEAAPVAGSRETGRTYPAAPAQVEFWVSDAVAEDLAVSTMPLLVRVEGDLDLAVLQRALDELIRRHDVLRTVLRHAEDGPEAVTGPVRPVPLDVVDDRAALDALARVPLSLEDGRLLAAAALRQGPEGSLVLLRLHHAAGDGWSIALLLRDLAEVYAALAEGRPLPQTSALQFADCAEWLAAARESSREELAAYWRGRLDGAEVRSLPPTRPGAGDRRVRRTGSRVVLPLPAGLQARLARFCADHGVTEHAVLTTLTAVRVHRETGDPEVAVRAPVSNRRRPEFEDVVGPFLETALLPVRLDPSASFLDACRRVAEDAVEDLERAWVETTVVNDVSGLSRSSAGAPVGQILVAVQTYDAAEHAAGGLRWRYVEELDNGGAKTDLGIFWELNVADGALLAIEFDDHLHTAEATRRLGDQLVRLLDAALVRSAEPVAGLPWVGEEDLAVIDAHHDRPLLVADATTTARVLDQAARTPEATAVLCPRRGEVTYAALVRTAADLSARIDGTGAPDGAPVAVACRRGAVAVAAMLGVWLGGRPYLPLDPTHPAERLRTILDDAGAACLVTDGSVGDDLAPGLPLLQVGDDPGPGAAPRPVDRSRSEGTAYLIYTSGSTGRPKGVRVGHRALSGFLTAMAEHVPLRSSDVVAAVTTPSFDISGLETWLPLVHGARVGVVTEEEARDGAALAARLRRTGTTVLQMTPSGWTLLLDGADADLDQSGVRALVGAEPVPPELAARLLERCAQVWNVYGPTEATIWSTLHRVRPGDTTGDTLPVGRPLATTRAYVLDHAGQLAPPGVAGFVHLVGSSLAEGYHGRDDLTAAAFAPLRAVDGAPLSYRTGDLGRLDAEGLLHCLGRADNQVKVRGVRIELEEVDGVLRSLPGVVAATSAVPRDGAAAGQLVGYVVLAPDASPDVAAWREAAARQVPSAMVPTLWSVLDTLPLNTSGKVARAALPAPEVLAEAEPEEPLTELEEFLAELWAEVLPVHAVPAGGNFFELGGHSLSATRVVASVRHELQLDLSVRSLFLAPVLRDFAAEVEQLLLAEETEGATP